MKKRTRSFWRVGRELLCVLLVLGMMVGMVPMTASEAENQTDTPATIKVAKLTKDAPRGTLITEEYVEVVTLKNVNIPSNVISDPEEIYSKYAKIDIYAGEFISEDQLSKTAVRPTNSGLLVKPLAECEDDYVIVTDYVRPNTGEDLSTFLQEIIDKNPRRTIYFPDGEYVIARPLRTSARGTKSTSIQLSDGAVIKAASGLDWKNEGGDALICLGASEDANDIQSIGSYYTLIGGTLDGNGVTNGVSIDSGRETVVRNICIRNAKVGIEVKKGANNGSSDLDFEDITIIGQGRDSVGIEVKGWDNTFSNIRIYNVKTGMDIQSEGNLVKGIYVFNEEGIFTGKTRTVGIKATGGTNWFSQCHFVNCAVGFYFTSGSPVWDSTATWTTNKIATQYMFQYSGRNLTVSGCRAEFCVGDGVDAKFVSGDCDAQFIEGSSFDTTGVNSNYEKFVVKENAIIPLPR